MAPVPSEIRGKPSGKKGTKLTAKKVAKGAKLNSRSSSGPSKIKSKPFLIVGIGASAGGLEAFTDLLRHLPSDTGMAFVLIQHLDPKHESMLTLLLSKATPMPIREAKDGEAVEPNHVYVIPPNTDMTISNRVLHLMPREEIRGRHMVIDHFFRSLAEDQRSKVIGIILSGTASDGTLGLKAIKAEGGITFAQDEKSAKYGGMPHSAVVAGAVDFILPPEEIAKELTRLSRSSYVLGPATSAPINQSVESETSGLNLEEELRKKIFSLLLTSKGVNFAYYKHATVERRILRRMGLRKMESLKDYVKYIQDNPGELDALYQDILIHVTGFFRDPKAFDALKKAVFPILLKKRSPEVGIRVWVPGCSTGEEAYSLAITLMEFLGKMSQNIPIQIFATDIDGVALEKAQAGKYTGNMISDVSAERLQRFFTKVEGGYQVSKPVREICVFARHDLTRDPPFSSLDLISCRNVLIYMGPLLQKRVMGIFHYALKTSGYLLLGKSESIGGFSEFFALADKKHKIYSRKTTAARLTYGPAAAGYEIKKMDSIKEMRKEGLDVEEEADRIVLSRYAPAGVIINDHMDILHFRGHTGPYIEPSPGAASWNLLRMAQEGLKLELRTAIHEARKKDAAVRREGLQVPYNGEFREVNIEVLPIKGPPGERFFLILFEEGNPPALSKGGLTRKEISLAGAGVKGGRKGAKETSKAVQLERELAATKKFLQSVIEEQEGTNEELRAANEEILSSNEEFQSVNEELETSRQELESSNEELTTLNQELHNRNSELAQLNNDLINLLGNANLPIVMLGGDLRIRRFTAMAERILNLIPTDVGRPVTDIKLGMNLPDLESQVLEVIKTVAVKEMEITDRKNCWYSLQIRPYRTSDNKIDGAVLVFADIDALKKSMEKIKESLDYAEAIIETVREPLVILDQDLKVKTANRSFYKTFQVKPEQTENRLIYDLGDRQWDIPELRRLFEEILPQNTQFQDFEVDHEFSSIGHRVMLLNARPINQHGNGLKLILLAIDDITVRKTLEGKIKDFNNRLLLAYEQERKRISHELHDSLAANLAAVKMGLERKLNSMKEGSSSREIKIEDSISNLQRNIEELRRIMNNLHPSVLDDLGLFPAISWFCREFRSVYSGIRVEEKIAIQESEVPKFLNIVIFRILQEALNNTAKHSKANLIRVFLAKEDGSIQLVIEDNGQGFDLAEIDSVKGTRGLGLGSMKERVDLSGGVFDIVSHPGEGTTIQARWPRTTEPI